ncbi:arginine--tRNA ligase [Sulfolobus acidocaldarius]|uniref:Arginine--tRNA ligase n=4 Tax=Sulfolobus acidocaldarius TaxID=2285 RepID=SYR_SULAC|nr:arginine--tRNA ligase [Sulfolobus acidocaldarius]Q4J904.1 RecName: Full=Arginine--tRNA ligase; AltName: Full=Arginyl-tRNA synthetase; Short=ArgRS [Sulfolobus acidocaldarius DSM 639]AAY80726.1 arginyl-tRNA synthetase [Sulfolobus acidocaldarius DSM 639]AGE71323.1 arginyl-tRNA synthetase [Sulfolobus acidocaldarius N8]AGE73592.1 arginyl-tRNA synthetase [Sulfolobus acidocaldarius Ron12/I]ALU30422.1 arginine--tRNA ligase [Sulfolobus acidocaldarius]ALU31143.1 arginine--tRNA ligase [Sulfolobus aci
MNPIRSVKEEFCEIVANGLGISKDVIFKTLEYPPREELGDISLPLPSLKLNVRTEVTFSHGKLIKEVRKTGIYVNAFVDEKELFKLLFTEMQDDYGVEKTENPKRIVVEHTSANPIHPLHIGHLRNSILGDTISRMLKIRGHDVNRRFYVNDAGRQVAILTLGYILLGEPEPSPKVDHWFGLIYSITNVIIEIRELKEELKKDLDPDTYKDKINRLDELVATAQSLRERNPEFFDKLADAINSIPDVESEIQKIIKSYEKGDDPKIKQIVRKIVNLNLDGFRESLDKLEISFDVYDYESELLWSGMVDEILSKAFQIAKDYKGTKALELEDINEKIKEILNIPKGLKLPPLVLTRSDGTSLYTTRDIAYTVKKFSDFKADTVINVIAEQQSIPQMQLRASLYLLGYERLAQNLVHYSYGMVNLQGMRMSGRLGRFISLDDVIEKVSEVAKKKIEEKSGDITNLRDIVNSAIRYAILSVASNKPVTFNINNIVDFEQNSGPYLQYTYARAYNILAKNQDEIKLTDADLSDLIGDKRRLLLLIARFPETFNKAIDELRPEDLIDFLRRTADVFNRWYNFERVLQEPDYRKRITRLFIVKGIERVLYNGLNALGIKPLSKM